MMGVITASIPGLGGRPASKVVGEVFGRPVTEDEFSYYLKTAVRFSRTGKSSRSDEEARREAWQNMVFRWEANRLAVTAERRELKEQLNRLMSERNVEYGSKDYRELIKAELNESVDVFERRIEDMLIVNKLIKIKTEPEVTVTEEAMRQRFQDQYSSFESEYIVFKNKEDAEMFLERVEEKARLWKDTYDKKKTEGKKGASWISVMSVQALVDLWKIPRDDAYRILGRDEGDFVAGKLYYGDVVFRLLQKKEADPEKYTDKKKKYYRDSMTSAKKRRIVKEYFDDLFERASYRDYVAEEGRAARIEDLKKESLVVLKTNRGTIKLKLFPDIAPKACENFVGLIKKGYYDGLIFHRVIKGFMIQGGDPTGTGRGGESIWGAPFEDEVSGKVTFDRKGILAMANSGPNTNGSQFFITTKPVSHLNNKHTIFGEVVSGYEIVEQIENTPTDSSDRPKEEQKIVKASVPD